MPKSPTSTTEVFFENVKVPASSVLGEPGRGFKVAMEVLNSGRMGLASGALGMCKRVIKLAVERCNERREMRYVQTEVAWFNALKVAQDLPTKKARPYRHQAYLKRAQALAIELKEKC